MTDVELDAMQRIVSALNTLTADTRARVLRWITERYPVGPKTQSELLHELKEHGR